MTKWRDASKTMPRGDQIVLIWDAEWKDAFVKHVKTIAEWDFRRYTHWIPIDPPKYVSDEGKT